MHHAGIEAELTQTIVVAKHAMILCAIAKF
jgi:hypothetical protein